ncbi:ABC transporter ATP-binding protein [Desulfogranum mediterraneum]|uniref:ABC transporter ATP-binding protein n=1 Tax=Desulfogranum mediterraneum TaxID=160661 RepID=UPI000406E23F|nr:ABC transporter ATP-binding protein [Desulfogranum mediterraneum]
MAELPLQAPSIVLDQVSVCFEGISLFERLSITIRAGECTCILGPSGCGKSTLLRLVAGSTAVPFKGEMRILAEDPAQAKVAWMGQDDLLLPWFTLLDNILLGARLRGEVTPQRREKALGLLKAAGLEGYAQSFPGTLSGGMRQRGALLRTLMEERSILLMDEPFSALDALTRLKLQELSADLTRGATVLLVTHDPLEALRMADTILVLSQGPARVKSVVSLTGRPPRAVDSPEISKHYPVLLGELLAGEAS